MSEREAEIFTATKPAEVLAHTEILVLRQMSENLSRLWTGFDKLSGDVGEVKLTVARIEGAGALQKIDTLDAKLVAAERRIDSLESDRDRRSGARDLIGWVMKNTPWILAIGGLGSAYYFKH